MEHGLLKFAVGLTFFFLPLARSPATHLLPRHECCFYEPNGDGWPLKHDVGLGCFFTMEHHDVPFTGFKIYRSPASFSVSRTPNSWCKSLVALQFIKSEEEHGHTWLKRVPERCGRVDATVHGCDDLMMRYQEGEGAWRVTPWHPLHEASPQYPCGQSDWQRRVGSRRLFGPGWGLRRQQAASTPHPRGLVAMP